jgi:putative pyruvate formate lyase activating enzyme
MICAEPTFPDPAIISRSELARERARLAHAALTDCHLCAHHCGVNRRANETGLCRAGAKARIFIAQTEVSDELALIPTFAIAFSGCDLRCDFCITGASSWNPRAGEILSPGTVAERAMEALAAGARTIMILGGEPTIHLPTALEIVAALPDSAKLIWKTNAHGSASARDFLNGMFNVWLADYKFGNDACAQRLARVPDYVHVVQENLRWANEHSELIVRHLLMPGHVECCWRPTAEWLGENLPGTKINLRSGFWPAWHASRHSDLCGTVSQAESDQAVQIAQDCELNLIK